MQFDRAMKRILVAVDGSPDSLAAAELAETLARSADARLELVFVLEPGVPHFPLEHADTAQAPEQRRAEQVLTRAAERLRCPVSSRIERGGAAETLCRLAQAPDVTMIVAGSHGRHSLLRSLMGSASQHLLRTCPKPVVLVRAALEVSG